ncbi:hypothetical protein GOV04_00960 [Candidatus Woesearchaeota archaeon]|nr:hypothetical protein [Candidatus Woesearchaeota archaeon]
MKVESVDDSFSTTFSLSPEEQQLYQQFRQKHDNYVSGFENFVEDEKEKKQIEIEQDFAKLIRPYFKQHGLKIVTVFPSFSIDRLVSVNTPAYRLFDDDEPFDIGYKVSFMFNTSAERLKCHGQLYRKSKNPREKDEDPVIKDILTKIYNEKQQDGLTNPKLSVEGIMSFASTDFAVPLMQMIKTFLSRLGKDSIKELEVLYWEWLARWAQDKRDGLESVQQRVFKKAYDNMLELELKSVGLLEHKLNVVI